MKKAYKAAIKHFLKEKCLFSVWDGEEWAVIDSRDLQVIYAAINSVDQSEVRIKDQAGDYIGTIVVIPGCGMEPDETISDYSPAEGVIDKWFNNYLKEVDETL